MDTRYQDVDMNQSPYSAVHETYISNYDRKDLVEFYQESECKMLFLNDVLAIHDNIQNNFLRDVPSTTIQYAAEAFRKCCDAYPENFIFPLIKLVSPSVAVSIGYMYFCIIHVHIHDLDVMNRDWIMGLAYLYSQTNDYLTLEEVMQKFKMYYDDRLPFTMRYLNCYTKYPTYINFIGKPHEFLDGIISTFRAEVICRTMWDMWEIDTKEELECPVAYAQWLPMEMVEDVNAMLV